MKQPLYKALVSTSESLARAELNNADQAVRDRQESIFKDLTDLLPRGSGFDAGTQLVEARPDKIVMLTSYHHMDDAGGYDGWTEHKITVKPSLLYDIDIRITGKDRNDIKDYIAEVFYSVLSQDVDIKIDGARRSI